MPSSLRKIFTWFAPAAALVAIALCALSVQGIVWHQGVPVSLGWMPESRGDDCFVADVDQNGPARGRLSVGDQIISINGSTRAAHFGPPPELLAGPQTYSIDVRRNGETLHLALPLWVRPDPPWKLYLYLSLALVNLGLGIWIGAARPGLPAARVSFFVQIALAATFATATLSEFPPHLAGVTLWLAVLFASEIWQPLEWAAVYDVALRFPQSISQPALLRLLRVLFYVTGALLLVGILPLLAGLFNLEHRSALLPGWFPLALADRWRPVFSDALGAAVLFSVPIVLISNYNRLPERAARRRLRWVGLGISLAVLAIGIRICARLLLPLLGYAELANRLDSPLDTAAAFVSILIPITLTYAIVKHRIHGIRFVIRRSVQYLLARNVLRLLLYLPLIAIAVDIVLHPHEGLAEFLLHKSWWFYLTVIASASLSLRYHTRLQLWVDRKFFRSAYEEQVILSDLIEQLQSCETTNEVARVVSRQIEQTLQPSSVCVLFRHRSNSRFTVAHPFDSPLALHFRGLLNDHFQDVLQSERLSRPLSDVASAFDSEASFSAEDLHKALITPITTPAGELLGALLLGEKKSEQAYSDRDRKLLQAVATQIALVLEMLALRDQVREDGRVRVEVLARLDQHQVQLILECPTCGCCYSSPSTRCETDNSPLALTLPIERIIEGKYRLDRRIGAGGMGAVYEASDLRLERKVAVKVMTGRLFGNTAALRRFEREARAAARLQHPGIVAIYDFGSLRGEGAYLVMQLVDGRSWRAEMLSSGQIQPARVSEWLNQLCEAMACAHGSGVIHRDLKPENLLVSANSHDLEKITILDFGLAKLRSAAKEPECNLTTEDVVVGTQGYMSPEQRKGEPVDEHTDVYSMAVIIGELLTNNRPPAAGASRKWLRTVLRWPVSNLSCSEVSSVLLRCMADNSAQRMSVRDLQHLVPLLHDCPPPLVTTAPSAPNVRETLVKSWKG